MDNYVINAPDERKAGEMATPLIDQVARIGSITTREQHETALLLLKEIREVKREIVKIFAEPKSSAHNTHRAICAAERTQTRPLDEADLLVSRMIDTYEAEQARRLEQQRLEAQAAAREADDEKRLEAALRAEADGDTERANALIDEEPFVAPVPVVETETAAVDGVVVQTRYTAEVVDHHELIRFIAENPHYAHLVTINQTALNRMAVAQRHALRIPGVTVREKTVRLVRSDR